MKLVILALALFAAVYAAPNHNDQDAEIEEFIKLAQGQGANVEDFLNMHIASSEKAAEQEDDDEEDKANIQAAFLAELQSEDEEAAAVLQELAVVQNPKVKAQVFGSLIRLIVRATRRRRRRRRRRG